MIWYYGLSLSQLINWSFHPLIFPGLLFFNGFYLKLTLHIFYWLLLLLCFYFPVYFQGLSLGEKLLCVFDFLKKLKVNNLPYLLCYGIFRSNFLRNIYIYMCVCVCVCMCVCVCVYISVFIYIDVYMNMYVFTYIMHHHHHHHHHHSNTKKNYGELLGYISYPQSWCM